MDTDMEHGHGHGSRQQSKKQPTNPPTNNRKVTTATKEAASALQKTYHDPLSLFLPWCSWKEKERQDDRDSQRETKDDP